MKSESWIFGVLAIFLLLVTPVYGFMTGFAEPAGLAAMVLAFFLSAMITGYLALVARKIDARPEDRKDGEIAEMAGELGFYPPQSKWPLFCGLAMCLLVLAPIFGWWLMVLAVGVGTATLTGWIYEFYRGNHAH